MLHFVLESAMIYRPAILQPIEGAFVRLKEFTANNITDGYLKWLNDPVVVKYSNQRFIKHTRQTSFEYFETFTNTSNLLLAVYLKDQDRYVGTMSVYISNIHETADIGIMIGDRSCWGNGVGSDAWITIMKWLLDIVKIRKITGGTLRCNVGMHRIMVNSGMLLDGVRIGQEIADEEVQDIMHFAKFNRNWRIQVQNQTLINCKKGG